MDLYGFKRLNDTEGHDSGDEALRLISKRLLHSLRKPDALARLGGDEFVAVICDPDPRAAAREVILRLDNLTRAPLRLGDRNYTLDGSKGVAIAAPGESWDILLARADTAMYHVKRGGVGGVCFDDHGLENRGSDPARGQEPGINSAVQGA